MDVMVLKEFWREERGSPGQELGQIWVVSIPRGRETTIRLMRSINLLFESRLALPALLLLLRLEARHSILFYCSRSHCLLLR